MAELGDLLIGGSQRTEEVQVEMMDYDFLDNCTDSKLVRAILQKLISGEEGLYPNLTRHAEKRLLELLPQAERTKILRLKSEPQLEEIQQARSELNKWEDEITGIMAQIKNGKDQDRHAPGWSSSIPSMSDDFKAAMDKNGVTLIHLKDDHGHNAMDALSDMEMERKAATTSGSKRLSGYNFRAWEAYDVEGELEKLDQAEEEMRVRNEAITSARTRAEEDAKRRATKREARLLELTRGRFKERLCSVEKKRVAEQERLKGNECFKAKEFEEAFRFYTFSLALDDTDARAYTNRAAAAQKLERFDQAEDDCGRAITLDPGFKKVWMRRGMVRHSRGKYKEAIEDFEEALRLDPTDRHAQKLREHSVSKRCEVEGPGVIDFEENICQEGRRVVIEEVDDVLQVTDATLGQCHPVVMEDKRRVSILTDSEEGYAQSTKAVGMRPSAGEKLESLLRDGKVLYWEQKFGEANDSFRRAHDIAHQSQTEGSVTAQIASNISACMLQQRDFHGVLEWTEHVLKRDPQNQKALLRRWLALSELGKAEEAGRSLANLEKVPMDDNTRKAVNDHKVALAADEEKQRALRCTNLRKQGNELMAAGEKELAIEKYSAALREDPHNLAASNNRAQAFLDLRRFEQAEKDATVALESDPDNLKASYRRGRARFFRDNPDKRGACMDLTRVVSKDPNNDQAKTLLKQIVESLELDEAAAQRIEGKAVPRRPSLSRGGSGSNPNSHVSFGDGTEPGDDVSTDEERATRDKEVQAMHPDTAKTHWPDPKTRSGLVIVEDDGDGDDDGDSDGCTWCPVVEDKTVEDGGVSHSNWVEAEELRVKGHLEKALEVFTRGAVADPANTLCWIGLARVNRALSNYKRSLEAASRAVRIDPKNRSAVLCSALASLHLDAENLTEDELKVQVQDIHLRLTDMGEDQPELQGPDALELQELDAFIGGS